jgi:phage gp36-like protein
MARYTTAQDFVSFFGGEELAQLLTDELNDISPDALAHLLGGHERCPAGGAYCFSEEHWLAAQRGVDRYELIATQVCNHIDSKIGNRYRLPLTPVEFDITPLRRCATMLSRCMLMDDDDNSSERSDSHMGGKHKFDTCPYWDSWLCDVASGAADLGPDIAPSPSPTGADPASRIRFGVAKSGLDKNSCGDCGCYGNCERCR